MLLLNWSFICTDCLHNLFNLSSQFVVYGMLIDISVSLPLVSSADDGQCIFRLKHHFKKLILHNLVCTLYKYVHVRTRNKLLCRAFH